MTHSGTASRASLLGLVACIVVLSGQTAVSARAQGAQAPNQTSSSELSQEIAREVEAIEERFDALQATVDNVADAAIGTIVAWYPTSDDLDEEGNLVPPMGWLVCDGTNDTPDLHGRFIYGTATAEEIGDWKDAEEHTHRITLRGSTHNESMDNGDPHRRAAAEHTHAVPLPPSIAPSPPMVRMVYLLRARSVAASDELPAAEQYARAQNERPTSLLARQLTIATGLDALEGILGELTPSRFIVAWYPTAEDLDADGNIVPPRGWLLADGTRGTPVLKDRFIFGTATIEEVNTEDGTASHGHTVTTGSSGVHSRSGDDEGRGIAPAYDHRHTVTLSDSDHLPPALRMPFLMSSRRAVPERETGDTFVGMMLGNTRRLERLEEAAAAVFPSRAIVAWYPTSTEVDIDGELIPPTGWVMCDGRNGTPNLVKHSIYGTASMAQVGMKVGSPTHTHGGRAPLGGGYPGNVEDDPDVQVARGDHWHDVTAVSEALHLPALVRLVYLMKQEV